MPSGLGVNADFGGTNVPAQYQAQILLSAQRWGIPPAILAAQLDAESGFNPHAVSPAGAEGIAQFMPGTAKSMGVDPWNVSSAIDGMAHLDSIYFHRFGGWDKALAAYHDGPAHIGEGVVSGAGQNYVKRILAAAGSASASASGSTPVATPVGLTDSLSNLTHLVTYLSSGLWWKRVGVGTLGVALVILGLFFMATKQPGTMKALRKVQSQL